MSANTVLFIRDVPKDIKAKFKAACAREGKTMTEKVLEFMETTARKDQQKTQKGAKK